MLGSDQAFDVLLGDSDCRFVTANNVTEESGRSQYGGVAALNFPRLAGFTMETGKDPSGLGRWAYTYVGTAASYCVSPMQTLSKSEEGSLQRLVYGVISTSSILLQEWFWQCISKDEV